MGLYLTDREIINILDDVADATDFQYGSYNHKDMIFSMGIIQGKLDIVRDLLSGKFIKKED